MEESYKVDIQIYIYIYPYLLLAIVTDLKHSSLAPTKYVSGEGYGKMTLVDP